MQQLPSQAVTTATVSTTNGEVVMQQQLTFQSVPTTTVKTNNAKGRRVGTKETNKPHCAWPFMKILALDEMPSPGKKTVSLLSGCSLDHKRHSLGVKHAPKMDNSLDNKRRLIMEHAPNMDWSADSLEESFKLFSQQAKLYFQIKNVPVAEQRVHILRQVGEEGLKRYNSWASDNTIEQTIEEPTRNTTINTSPESTENFRVARLKLMTYRQGPQESLDDFVDRCKLQVLKCLFRPAEMTERIIELIIVSTRNSAFQKVLLGKGLGFTLEEALRIGRTFETQDLLAQQREGVMRGTAISFQAMETSNGKVCDKANHGAKECQCTPSCTKGQEQLKPLTEHQPEPSKNQQGSGGSNRVDSIDSAVGDNADFDMTDFGTTRVLSVESIAQNQIVDQDHPYFDSVRSGLKRKVPNTEGIEHCTENDLVKAPNKKGSQLSTAEELSGIVLTEGKNPSSANKNKLLGHPTKSLLVFGYLNRKSPNLEGINSSSAKDRKVLRFGKRNEVDPEGINPSSTMLPRKRKAPNMEDINPRSVKEEKLLVRHKIVVDLSGLERKAPNTAGEQYTKSGLKKRPRYTCPHCHEVISNKGNFIRHNLRKHSNGKNNHRCVLCDSFFCAKRTELGSHYETEHGKTVRFNEHHFPDFDQFETWKTEKEQETHTRFRSLGGAQFHKRTNSKCYQFRCNRSGKIEQKLQGEERKRKLKKQGSCRTNQDCTAFMDVSCSVKDGTVQVVSCFDHAGHELELCHISHKKPVFKKSTLL